MRWLLLGYMYLVVHRPFEIWPALGEIRLEWLYMLVTGGVWVAYLRKKWVPNFLHLAFAVLALAVLVSWLLSPWGTEIAPAVDTYFKQLVFYVLLVTVVDDERGLWQLTLGLLVVMALHMSHSLYEYLCGRFVYRMNTARMVGVDTTLGDPNSFAASIVYGLPLVAAFWRSRPSALLRGFLIGYVTLSVGCILLTGSRTGFVGLLAVVCLWCVNRRNWWRLALPVVCLSPLVWLALPAELQNRFETILFPEVGPANAKVSADSRLRLFLEGVELFQQYPLSGVGPDAFGLARGHGVKAHNLYGQTLGELGSLGVLGLALVLIGFLRNHLALRRYPPRGAAGEAAFPRQLTRAVSVSVLMLLLMGWGGHNLFRYTWLWYGGFQLIALHCLKRQAAAGVEEAFADEVELSGYNPRAGWGLEPYAA
jgi:O-Antigen ligase